MDCFCQVICLATKRQINSKLENMSSETNSTSSPKYKLTYFPVKALAEPIRMLFKYGSLDFDDVRVEKNSDIWEQLKPHTPFGQVPILEVDGQIAPQSIAIARYVAKQVKLTGKTDWDDLLIDSVVDTINDLRQKIGQYYSENNEEIKRLRKETLFKEILPFYQQRLDNLAKENNGHLVLGCLTWADIYFVGLLDFLNSMAGIDITEGYSGLQAVKNNVLIIPDIKEWIETRPDSPY